MELSSGTVSFDGQALKLDTAEDAELICEQIDDRDVEVLILQGNSLNTESAERIGISLSKQPTLREAHFKDLFTSRGADVLPFALGHLLKGISDSGAQLTLLDLSDNAIGPTAAPPLMEFLDSSSAETIEKLLINNCGMGIRGGTWIAQKVPRLRQLRELIWGRNRLEDEGAKNMSRALSSLSGIEVLKFPQNGIRPSGIKDIAQALKAHQETLRELDLSDNTIKVEGAEALAQVLSAAPNLEVIRLDDALLENEGFSIICGALSRSMAKLKYASFEGNELNGQSIVDMIEIVFDSCSSDFTLNLLANDFTKPQANRLEKLNNKFKLLVDDEDDGDYDNEDEDTESASDHEHDKTGEESDKENNDYVDIESEIREVTQDFIKSVGSKPFDKDRVNSAFIQLISTLATTDGQGNYQVAQILCEELGLIKCEQTRKKKELARDSIVYLGKRRNEIPPVPKTFIELVVKNNDEMECGKFLFDSNLDSSNGFK